MKVTGYHVYGDRIETFQGAPDEARKQINARFGYLANYGHKLLQEDLEKLGNSGVGHSTCPLTIKCFMTT